MELTPDDPLAVAACEAVQAGDVAGLVELLDRHPGLAAASIGEHPDGPARTLLHVLTDWPGHLPNGAGTVRLLVAAGADVDARFRGPHTETPLHWAASSDDVAVLDALLDAGADIEAPGAVIAGGTPLADATAFGQWNAARRLVERGAEANLFESATLGLVERVEDAPRRRAARPGRDQRRAVGGVPRRSGRRGGTGRRPRGGRRLGGTVGRHHPARRGPSQRGARAGGLARRARRPPGRRSRVIRGRAPGAVRRRAR